MAKAKPKAEVVTSNKFSALDSDENIGLMVTSGVTTSNEFRIADLIKVKERQSVKKRRGKDVSFASKQTATLEKYVLSDSKKATLPTACLGRVPASLLMKAGPKHAEDPSRSSKSSSTVASSTEALSSSSPSSPSLLSTPSSLSAPTSLSAKRAATDQAIHLASADKAQARRRASAIATADNFHAFSHKTSIDLQSAQFGMVQSTVQQQHECISRMTFGVLDFGGASKSKDQNAGNGSLEGIGRKSGHEIGGGDVRHEGRIGGCKFELRVSEHSAMGDVESEVKQSIRDKRRMVDRFSMGQGKHGASNEGSDGPIRGFSERVSERIVEQDQTRPVPQNSPRYAPGLAS